MHKATYQIECSHCGAPKGSACQTRGGAWTAPHFVRWKALNDLRSSSLDDDGDVLGIPASPHVHEHGDDE